MYKHRLLYCKLIFFVILFVFFLYLFLLQFSQQLSLQRQLSASESFQHSFSSFTLQTPHTEDFHFSIENSLINAPLILSIRETVSFVKKSTNDFETEIISQQEQWGKLRGKLKLFSANDTLLIEDDFFLQHSLKNHYKNITLPLAKLPSLAPAEYKLSLQIENIPSAKLGENLALQLNPALTSLDYLKAYYKLFSAAILLIICGICANYAKKVFLTLRRRKAQEKWQNDRAGRKKIMYLFTRYPLWSETFLRQDLKLLLQEKLPLLPAALFPGDCESEKDWPKAEIIFPQKTNASENSKKNLLRSLFYFLPLAIRKHLSYVQHKKVLRELINFCHKNHIAHIHVEFADLAAFLTVYAAKELDISFSLSVHAADIFSSRYCLKTLCHRAKFISVCNNTAAAALIKKYPRAEKKLQLIYHGLELKDWQFRESLELQKPLELFFAGRFVEKKGIFILLEAFAILQKQGLELKLTLAGSGPLQEELQAKAEKLQITDKLKWCGVLSRMQIAQELQRVDILCLPSLQDSENNQEGIPNIMVEAMASGVPVAGSMTGGIGELLNEETGYTIRNINPQKLADTITEIIENKEERNRKRKNAREIVEKRFDAKKHARQRRRLLESIV